MRYFLSVKVIYGHDMMCRLHHKYILGLLDVTSLKDSKPMNVPKCVGKVVDKFYGLQFFNHAKYRRIIGSRQYLTFTKPNIAFDSKNYVKLWHVYVIYIGWL